MTALTVSQIAKLNKMNRAAQDGTLGTRLNALEVSGTSESSLLSATAGVATASKAAILGANKNLDVLAIADLKLGAGAGTSVTSTAEELNILDGVTKTFSDINNLVAGVAGGYKVAYGTKAVGAASEDVVTGLTTVLGVTCSLVGDPSMTHMFSIATVGNQTGQPAAGSIRIKSFKPTAADNVAPIAADTVFANVAWIAFGN